MIDDMSVVAVLFSPDGRLLVSALFSGAVVLRTTHTLEVVFAYVPDGIVRVTGLAFSPDAAKLLLGCWDGTLVVVQRVPGEGQWAGRPLQSPHLPMTAACPGTYTAWLSNTLVG
jgi:WD40 repeat protein